MGQPEIACVTIVVALALLGFAILLNQRQRAKSRERAAEHLAEVTDRLLALVGRLDGSPCDQSVARKIVESAGEAGWVPGDFYQPSRDLWDRALRYSVDHLDDACGRAVAYRVLVPLASSPVGDQAQLVRSLHEALTRNPTSRALHEVLMNCLRALEIAPSQSQWLYDRTLDLLQRAATSSELAVLALEIGRWHLGRLRPGGAVSIYDEQAIHNDIAVRRTAVGGSAPSLGSS
jgi:hypothetical protein